MELTRYGASHVVLLGTGLVRVRYLDKGRLHAMHWSSVTLSAILGKVVSRSLPNSSQSSQFFYRSAADSAVEC